MDEPADPEVEELVGDWLTLPDLADQLGLDILKVRQLVRDRNIAVVRRGERNIVSTPAAFVSEGQLVKGLTGLLTVLADGGFDSNEALRWMFTPEDSLPGTPIQAMRENRGTEVRRRAQALAI
ncbi:MAG: Rv2175c family DNA-binding protein [Actinomycetes bacterium]